MSIIGVNNGGTHFGNTTVKTNQLWTIGQPNKNWKFLVPGRIRRWSDAARYLELQSGCLGAVRCAQQTLLSSSNP